MLHLSNSMSMTSAAHVFYVSRLIKTMVISSLYSSRFSALDHSNHISHHILSCHMFLPSFLPPPLKVHQDWFLVSAMKKSTQISCHHNSSVTSLQSINESCRAQPILHMAKHDSSIKNLIMLFPFHGNLHLLPWGHKLPQQVLQQSMFLASLHKFSS